MHTSAEAAESVSITGVWQVVPSQAQSHVLFDKVMARKEASTEITARRGPANAEDKPCPPSISTRSSTFEIPFLMSFLELWHAHRGPGRNACSISKNVSMPTDSTTQQT